MKRAGERFCRDRTVRKLVTKFVWNRIGAEEHNEKGVWADESDGRRDRNEGGSTGNEARTRRKRRREHKGRNLDGPRFG